MLQRSLYERYEKIESINSSYSALSKFVEMGVCLGIPEECVCFITGVIAEPGDSDLLFIVEESFVNCDGPWLLFRIVTKLSLI